MKAQAAQEPQSPARAPLPLGRERAGGVLEHRQPVGQLLEAGGPSEQVHRQHGLRPWPDLDLRRIDVHRLGVDVDEHGPEACERDDVSGRREGVRRHEHLVARLETEREHREVERGRPGRDDQSVLDGTGPRELVFELGDLRAHRQHAAREHAGDLVELRPADVGPA